MFRIFLKKILGKLSRYAVKKHRIEIIAISGWGGTSIVREMLYHVLKRKYHVRRNTKEVWWDLSVPLTILGYEDKQRNVFCWIGLVLRAVSSILFLPEYPHKIIVNLDTAHKDTATFWSDYIDPHIMVLLRQKPESKVLECYCNVKDTEDTMVVYNPYETTLPGKCKKTFTYAKEDADIVYAKSKHTLTCTYKNTNIKIKLPAVSVFVWKYIPPVVASAVVQGFSLQDTATYLDDFPFHPRLFRKGLKHLKRFVREYEKKT